MIGSMQIQYYNCLENESMFCNFNYLGFCFLIQSLPLVTTDFTTDINVSANVTPSSFQKEYLER